MAANIMRMLPLAQKGDISSAALPARGEKQEKLEEKEEVTVTADFIIHDF